MKRLKVLFAVAVLAAAAVYASVGSGSATVAITLVTPSAPVTALPVATTPAFTDGSHLVKFAYVTSTGVGVLSAAGTTRTTDATHTAIKVSVVASSRTEVTSVNIYATKAGTTTPYYLVASGVADTTADVDVGALDAALTSAAPSTDGASAAADTTITLSSGYSLESLWVRNDADSGNLLVSLDGTTPTTTNGFTLEPNTPATLQLDPHPRDGSSVTTIKMRFATGGGEVSYVYSQAKR